MRLSDLPIAAIAELNTLAAGGAVDITSAAVRSSAFYQRIQTEEELNLLDSELTPATLLLIARIAATSPALLSVNMAINGLGGHGPATATALAASHSIHTVDMSGNGLREHGPATATALAASHSIHTVEMGANGLGEHGPATATALATSDTIHTVRMGSNALSYDGPATATALARSHFIHTVDMTDNGLREHGPATAAALATSDTIHTVDMRYNNEGLVEHVTATADTAAVVTAHNQYTVDLLALLHTPIFMPIIPIEGVVREGMPVVLVDLIGEFVETPLIDILV